MQLSLFSSTRFTEASAAKPLQKQACFFFYLWTRALTVCGQSDHRESVFLWGRVWRIIGPPGNLTFKLILWSIGVLFCYCSLCFLALNWSVIALLIGGPSEARLSPEVKLFCEIVFNPIFTRQNSFVDFQLCSRCAHGIKIKISLNIVVDNNSST